MSGIGPISGITTIPFVDLRVDKLFKVDQAEQVLEHISNASIDDLVILDVDEVLITLKDRFLRPKADEFCHPIFREIFYPLTEPEKLIKYGEWISQVKVELLTQKLAEGIRELQNRHIKVIALTRMIPGAGPCGKIPLMEDFRFQELKDKGIDFSDSLEEKRIELDFEMKENLIPLFKEGILYARPYSKGEVLGNFLKKITFSPQKIWFVDDSQYNVDSVQNVTRELNIPFVGIKYFDRKFNEEEFDLSLGQFQFQHFKETGIWLSDEKALDKRKNE